MTILGSTANEKRSLAAHVDLCALRYSSLEERMNNLDGKTDKIEAKLDSIDGKLDSFQKEIATLMFKGATGLVLILLSALAAISKAAGVW